MRAEWATTSLHILGARSIAGATSVSGLPPKPNHTSALLPAAVSARHAVHLGLAKKEDLEVVAAAKLIPKGQEQKPRQREPVVPAPADSAAKSANKRNNRRNKKRARQDTAQQTPNTSSTSNSQSGAAKQPANKRAKPA